MNNAAIQHEAVSPINSLYKTHLKLSKITGKKNKKTSLIIKAHGKRLLRAYGTTA